jgi:hypothetical protein
MRLAGGTSDPRKGTLMPVRFRDPAVPLTPDQLHLRKLAYKTIVADPEGFDISDWERHYKHHIGCRTTRCIAGWGQYLARGAVYAYGFSCPGEPDYIPEVVEDAIALFGLTAVEYGSDLTDDDDDGGLFYLPAPLALARLRELAGE